MPSTFPIVALPALVVDCRYSYRPLRLIVDLFHVGDLHLFPVDPVVPTGPYPFPVTVADLPV